MIINVNKPPQNAKGLTREVIESIAFDIMLELGIPINLKGFVYLVDAVRITYFEPMAGARIVDGLYKRIAEENDTTAQCVEHAIRTALKRTASFDDKNALRKYFSTSECPSPKRFINTLADWARRNIDEKANRTLHN